MAAPAVTAITIGAVALDAGLLLAEREGAFIAVIRAIFGVTLCGLGLTHTAIAGRVTAGGVVAPIHGAGVVVVALPVFAAALALGVCAGCVVAVGLDTLALMAPIEGAAVAIETVPVSPAALGCVGGVLVVSGRLVAAHVVAPVHCPRIPVCAVSIPVAPALRVATKLGLIAVTVLARALVAPVHGVLITVFALAVPATLGGRRGLFLATASP